MTDISFDNKHNVLTDEFEGVNCIAILGGTFNPVHNGHMMMAESALHQIDEIEKVVFMPNNLPAYKEQRDIASNSHRLNMLRLALSERSDMVVSDLELTRGGVTYTIDTLEQIKSVYSTIKIYFIIGDDSLVSFHQWHRYEQILSKCTLLVATRSETFDSMRQYSKQLIEKLGYGEIIILRNDIVNISSSNIREQLSQQNMPEGVMPEGVEDYIKIYGLYGWENT